METLELQKLCNSIARKIDKKESIDRNDPFCMSQIV